MIKFGDCLVADKIREGCFSSPRKIKQQLSTYQAILRYWIEVEIYRQRNAITRAFFNTDLPQLRTPVQEPNAYGRMSVFL